MHVHVLGFRPPIDGVEQAFNTFRLGLKLRKTLPVGSVVFLMDERQKVIFGRAEVVQVETGPLLAMCEQHGHANHSELGNDPAQAAASLFHTMQKIYGPHIATGVKKATVVYLRRLPDAEHERIEQGASKSPDA